MMIMMGIILDISIIILSLMGHVVLLESVPLPQNIIMQNIPDNLQHNMLTYDELLSELSSKRYEHTCKASALYNPKRSLFYFNNPSAGTPNKLSSYVGIKCRTFKSFVSWSKTQKFFVSFKDLEQILDNNEDSILQSGIHEISSIQKGIEVSFFPVKLYRKSDVSINNDKVFLCYDSVKVLGFDKSNKLYFLLMAGSYYEIAHCESQKSVLGNLIKYSSYCDEFCNEDYVYYSNDLIKCACDYTKVKTEDIVSYISKGSTGTTNASIAPEKGNNGAIHTNRILSSVSPAATALPIITKESHYKESSLEETLIERYSLFSNSNDLNKKKIAFDKNHNNVSYIRFYFHLFSIIVSIQIIYVFLIRESSHFFLKFNIVFYVIIIIAVYIALCIKSWSFDLSFDLIRKICDIICDIYPLIILVYLSFLSKRPNPSSHNKYNSQSNMVILFILMTMNSLDFILIDTYVNEIDLVFKGLFILGMMFIVKTEHYMNFFLMLFRTKMLLDFLTKLSLFLIQHSIMTNLTAPAYVLFGKPKESFISTSQLVFQANYVQLLSYSSILKGNWFMEALNFNRKKDIVVLMQLMRYFLLVYITHCVFLGDYGISFLLGNLMQFNIVKIIGWYVQIAWRLTCLGKRKKVGGLLVVYMISGVLCTADCLWMYLIHCAIGMVYEMLFEDNAGDDLGNDNEDERKRSQVRRILTSRSLRILSRFNLMDDDDSHDNAIDDNGINHMDNIPNSD